MKLDEDDKDSRPRPDPTVLTTAQLDREIAHLKELLKLSQDAEKEARRVALEAMDRRLLELPELRTEIVKVRNECVRTDVYTPAHEELRRQRQADGERMVGIQADIKANATNLARLESSVMWLSRLVVGALILAIIGYAFQRLLVR